MSGWTGTGSWTNVGTSPDAVVAVKSAGFTLSNTSLSSTDGMAMTLSGISSANLTDAGSGNTFTVNGWTGVGSLTGSGDALVDFVSGNTALSNTALTSAGLSTLTLAGITVANLTDTAGGNTLTLSGWTGTGSWTNVGASPDAVAAVKTASFTLSNTSLSSTDGMAMDLSGISSANLTDAGSGNTFTVNGWTGAGSLTGGGDALVDFVSGNTTLSNSALSTAGLSTLTLAGITVANLTDTVGGNTLTLSGWTGTGSWTNVGTSPDSVTAVKSAGFALSNTSLSSTDGMAMDLSGISSANLSDIGSGHSFTLIGWTGGGTLKGTAETLIDNASRSVVLTNTSLTASGLPAISLNGFNTANLSDSVGGNTLTLSGWTGTGSWTNSGSNPDAVAALKSASFTLSNTSLSSTDGMAMTLSGVTTANLAAGNASKTFTVDGWTGTGSLTDTGSGIVSATKNAGFTLSNTSLSSTDGMLMTLSGISTANLSDTGSGHSFAIAGWTGGSTLKGSAETLIDIVSRSVVLTNVSLSATGLPTVVFSGFITTNLTDTSGGNTFTVSGWTGNGSWTNVGASSDTVAATKASSFTLSNTSLSSTDGMAMTLSGVTTANLAAGNASKTFTVDGWTGTGSLSDTGSGIVSATKNAGFTLSNTSLSSTDGMTMSLSGISTANLTAAATSGNPTCIVDASTFGGVANLATAGTVNAFLFGGSGNGSTLRAAGSGESVLIGGSGIQTLSDTGTGYNILIGGLGGNSITGNGNDILISGTTSYDSDTNASIRALDAILNEWGSSDPYSLRISKILSGVGPGGIFSLNPTTVQSVSTVNSLNDGANPTQNNWFILKLNDKVKKQAQETGTIF